MIPADYPLYAQGTYRKAAASLGLTSTLVKARIQALESTVGGPLLYRKSGRLRFTELGYNFIGVALKVLQEEEKKVTSPGPNHFPAGDIIPGSSDPT
ncbi:helix-turn-helix domain-containing protein [Deinococcus cellulosilyticus]|uniref:HTH lysR-type domain-containing protein n=1 Tax=Deinococcus cellulosilyticus (strain DSM 18568 / NBRC 106333 / KACC 11606 / 5516J-15) TaxID=1223518 RepID=A0A511MZT5_DEIC1|nr:LysR family transcriptional regulator [Deinococcus cellulosilyticus]GEM45626.1 hypothetical protein DC3_12610 [Deinococcus cellulosilyticus NBRC 106333 = KACC 11606]